MIEIKGRSWSTMPSECRDGSIAPTCDGPWVSVGADTLGGGQNSSAARADACTASLPRCATTLINVLPVPALCCVVAMVLVPAALAAFSECAVGLSSACPRGDKPADSELCPDEVATSAESSCRALASSYTQQAPDGCDDHQCMCRFKQISFRSNQQQDAKSE